MLLEVLPLKDRVREDLDHALDERLDERVVGRATQAGVRVSDVVGVLEQLLVVGPHVERDGEGERRMDPGAGRVQGELADRDPHPARALVAEPEDPLVVGRDDQPNVLVPRVGEQFGDPVDVVRRQPQAARAAHDVAVLLARATDHRRVDDRHQFLDVLEQQA